MRRVAITVVALTLLAVPIGHRVAIAQTEPPATTAPSPTPPPAPPAPPAQQEFVYHGEAVSLLGRTVRDPLDQTIGRVVDVLVDDAGLPRAAIVDVGGFMGMGARRIAVAWRALHFDTSKGVGRITLDMSLDQIKGTPDFKRPVSPLDPPVTVAAPPQKP
jgi:hypothetical protein